MDRNPVSSRHYGAGRDNGAALSTVTFLDQRNEARYLLLLSTKPRVDFQIENDPDQLPIGVAIKNAGPKRRVASVSAD